MHTSLRRTMRTIDAQIRRISIVGQIAPVNSISGILPPNSFRILRILFEKTVVFNIPRLIDPKYASTARAVDTQRSQGTTLYVDIAFSALAAAGALAALARANKLVTCRV